MTNKPTQTTKLISRSQALDQAVFDAWSRFGESVGYYSNQAVERLSKPDALMFILARFKWYNLI